MSAETTDHLPPWHGKLPSMEEMFLGNQEAIAFVKLIAKCSHVYDDLIDNGSADKAEIHALFWDVLVGLPNNCFYVANAKHLTPILATGILNWRAANDMEDSGEKEEIRISHAIRYSVADVGFMAMVLVGGMTHAVKYARAYRLSAQSDTFAHYQEEYSNGSGE